MSKTLEQMVVDCRKNLIGAGILPTRAGGLDTLEFIILSTLQGAVRGCEQIVRDKTLFLGPDTLVVIRALREFAGQEGE
jgi:hypothetical protein